MTGEVDFELYGIMDPSSWCNIWKLEIFHGANSMCFNEEALFLVVIFMI